MKTVNRFVVFGRREALEEILRDAKDVSRTTYRKEFRLTPHEDVWIDFRIASDLWEQGLPETIVLVIAVREPQEFERRPFRRIWHVDVYAPNTAEEVFQVIRKDVSLCEEGANMIRHLLISARPSSQSDDDCEEKLKKIKEVLASEEGGEN